jgi:hypothetical protein
MCHYLWHAFEFGQGSLSKPLGLSTSRPFMVLGYDSTLWVVWSTSQAR